MNDFTAAAAQAIATWINADPGRGLIGCTPEELAAVAITAADEAERIATEPCDAEVPSWEMFSPGTVSDYWMRCDRIGPHDEHEHRETGATWT